MAGFNLNYFDDIWVDFSPLRRTVRAVDGYSDTSPEWENTLDQQKLSGQFTADIFANKSWRLNKHFHALKRSTFLIVNIGINNILDNKEIRTSGLESLRLDSSAGSSNEKFGTRYFYAFGLNYFASVTLRMN